MSIIIFVRYTAEGVRKVDVNKEGGMHNYKQWEEVCTWCKLSFPTVTMSSLLQQIA